MLHGLLYAVLTFVSVSELLEDGLSPMLIVGMTMLLAVVLEMQRITVPVHYTPDVGMAR